MGYTRRRPPSGGAPHLGPTFEDGIRNASMLQNVLNRQPRLQHTEPILKRSSSVYSRSTGYWDPSDNWQMEAPPLPVPQHQFSNNTRFSASTPSLAQSPDVSPLTPELEGLLPPLLEPRTYQPMLPSPSPSVKSILSHKGSDATSASATSSPHEDHPLWNDFAAGEIPLSPSPPPMSPISNYGCCQSHILLASNTTMRDYLWHKRSRSDNSPPVARLTRPFETPRSDQVLEGHMRNDSINQAFSHMRLGSDISRNDSASLDRSSDSEAQILKTDDIRSPRAQNRLVSLYRELAMAQTQDCIEEWDKRSQNTDDAHNIRFVPPPLFWGQRSKELYPNRYLHAQQKQDDENRARLFRNGGHRKRISLSAAPLKLIYPRQYMRKSLDSSRDASKDFPLAVSVKKSLSLRRRGKKHSDSGAMTASTRTALSNSASAPFRTVPIQLQLPSIAYQEEQKKSRPPRTKEHAVASELLKHQHLGTACSTSRAVNKRPQFDAHKRKTGPQASPPSSSRGMTNPFHKVKYSVTEASASVKEHKRELPSITSSAQPLTVINHGDDRRSIFEKAADIMRDRDRNKQRKELKSKIRFIGHVDPSAISNTIPTNGRASPKEGWI